MPERSAEEQIIDGCWADGFDATELLEEVKAQVRAAERAKLLAQLTDEATNARVIDAAARVLDEPAFIEREAGSRSARRVARLNARAALSAAVNRFQRDITKGQDNG